MLEDSNGNQTRRIHKKGRPLKIPNLNSGAYKVSIFSLDGKEKVSKEIQVLKNQDVQVTVDELEQGDGIPPMVACVLFGQVQDKDGPISGAVVTIESEAGTSSGVTDQWGMLLFEAVSCGTLSVNVDYELVGRGYITETRYLNPSKNKSPRPAMFYIETSEYH